MKSNDFTFMLALALGIAGAVVGYIGFTELNGFSSFITTSLGVFVVLCSLAVTGECIKETQDDDPDWDLFDE